MSRATLQRPLTPFWLALIVKVGKAIKDKGGAASDYQHVQLELRALQTTRERLSQLEPNSLTDEGQINAIRGVALACTIPLREFLDNLRKFEASMGPFSRPGRLSVTTATRKSQYALFFTDEVSKLRAKVAVKGISIIMLLVIHTLCADLNDYVGEPFHGIAKALRLLKSGPRA